MTAEPRRLHTAPEPAPWDHHEEPPPLETEPPPPHDDPRPTKARDDHTRPHDNDAERHVLGAMLRDRQAITDVADILTGPDFYQPKHELIYDAIVAAYARLDPVDPITIGDRLERQKDLTRIGGRAFLHELAQSVVITQNADYYADIVRDLAGRRRLIDVGTAIVQAGTSRADNIPDLVAQATEGLNGVIRTIPGVDPDTTHPWAPLDLDDILNGTLDGATATIGQRRDGQHLLYPGAIHSISGEPGGGKTWFGLIVAAQELDHGNTVTLIDFEDRPQTHIARLRALGITDSVLRAQLRYVRPHTALDTTGWTHLAAATHDATLVIVDGITEAMTLHGLSLMDNEDVARWIALLPRRVADTGPAVLQVDHVVKNSDARGRYAIGGQHKLAAIDGVAYKLITIRSFGQGNHGHAKLVIDKDRHGDVGPNGSTAADIHLDATASDGALYAWLDHPTASVDDEGHFRPTVLMERVSEFLLPRPGAQSLASICAGVKGKDASIVEAVDALVREGHARIESGPRNSKQITLLESFPRSS